MSLDFPDQSKIHETAEDRERQGQIIRAYAARFGFTVEFTKELDRQDARLYRDGTLVELVEAKYRNNAIDRYVGYKVDKEKVVKLYEKAKALGVPGKLIVSWEGDIRWLDVTAAMDGWQPGDDEIWDVGPFQRGDRVELADKAYKIPTDEKTFVRL